MAFGQPGGLQRQVISTLDAQGRDVMGLDTLAWKYPDNSIVSGSLLTVESDHVCVLESLGAALDVYETGQHRITTPDKPILGSIVQGFSAAIRPGSTRPSTSSAASSWRRTRASRPRRKWP